MTFTAGAVDSGKRLDHFLQTHLPEFSRSRLQEWIRAGHVLVEGKAGRPSLLLRGGEAVDVQPQPLTPLRAEPEQINLDILFEDNDVVAVNKPAGMVVHAGAGVHQGTLVNALLHRFGALSDVGGELRPGIVHRLDRYTSGAILVARTDRAHLALARQFARREVEKTYLTLVKGRMESEGGRIERPVTRDRIRRARMTSKLATGRTALTEYRVLYRYPGHTYLEVRIGTGRTHQIRVHLSDSGHPVVGDKLYGAPAEPGLARYFLHAQRLRFFHPLTGEPMAVEAPLAPELAEFLSGL